MRGKPQLGGDGIGLIAPKRVFGANCDIACQRPAWLAQDQARISAGSIAPCDPVGLMLPGAGTSWAALGDLEDFLGMDCMIAEHEVLAQRGRAAAAVSVGFVGLGHCDVPLLAVGVDWRGIGAPVG
jgi:hypothetical protein